MCLGFPKLQSRLLLDPCNCLYSNLYMGIAAKVLEPGPSSRLYLPLVKLTH